VVDKFLQQNENDRKTLHGYYENTYRKAKMNEMAYFIYNNPYTMSDIRRVYLLSAFSTIMASATLALIHPALLLLLSSEYYKVIRFGNILRNTCQLVGIAANKRQAYVVTYNFLGFEKKFKLETEFIRNIKYEGEYVNNYFNIGDFGLFPTISSYLRPNTKPSSRFRYFHKFSFNGRSLYISKDHKDSSENIKDEDLLLALMQGNLHRIYNYDYTEMEKEGDKLMTEIEEELRQDAKRRGKTYYSENDKKKKEYMDYYPNRDFYTSEELKLKKFDDGTFIDNGYR